MRFESLTSIQNERTAIFHYHSFLPEPYHHRSFLS